MIGFFEHQYLKFKKNHLKNLIALAKADGEIHELEEQLIYKAGHKYGLKDRQIESLLKSEETHVITVPENHNNRMNQLYDIMLMVYADGVVDDNEIEFCHDIVRTFGYKEGMVEWLIEKFASDVTITPQEWDEAKMEAQRKFM
ncbi:MAG: TerB family tellurite resistance protein [Cyclobacteriaceae bacterium]|nr:TerB family tellurite resistance protein [Cyclobacteriaceae bacterium]